MKDVIASIQANPRFQENIEFGEPRPGHPEGSVRRHIAELERNLEALRARGVTETELWKLRFMILVHDAFKAEADLQVSIRHPRSHASLARAFAEKLIDDPDLLNMIQFHDEPYAIWKQKHHSRRSRDERMNLLLEVIQDWDLYLKFLIIDGCTVGKDRQGLIWFIRQVTQAKTTSVDESWLL